MPSEADHRRRGMSKGRPRTRHDSGVRDPVQDPVRGADPSELASLVTGSRADGNDAPSLGSTGNVQSSMNDMSRLLGAIKETIQLEQVIHKVNLIKTG